MTKKYPIILYPIEENGATSYSVLIPDFPGCVSSGDSEQDAMENARAALDLHVQALVESGQSIAEPSTVDQVKDASEPGAIYGLVELPLSEVREKALARKSTRINITFPGELLNEIDEYCEKSGVARSRLFQQLAERFLRDVSRTGYSEQAESSIRNIFRSLAEQAGNRWADDRWADSYPDSSVMEAALLSRFLQGGGTAGVRASMSQAKPQSEYFLLFASCLFDAFKAFEKLRAAEELGQGSDRPPALWKNK
jgi:predicted RNase H-like HicB family nuclease